ncbi:MAG: hypothetical protein E4H14_03770 [Candidatus Thorarchaeota archaeon]|nr:MAG: hypothetical protein E4H14_03770 [Candidatus Thorarchaeota archaeon]
MGLFDGWRRKKTPVAAVQLKEPITLKTKETSTSVSDEVSDSEDVEALVAKYERLVQRREELQTERQRFTALLDRGEIDSDEFRKELMDRIQEAATVSENIRVTATRLTALGYRGYH